jgi:parallel beta-helix repeat protein
VRTAIHILTLAFFLLAAGCVKQPAGGAKRISTVWAGTVIVEGVEEVGPGETLTIRPGTRVLFTFLDSDANGWGDAGILVKGGRVLALGTDAAPITFEPEGRDRRPGRWGEIRIESGGPSRFAHCRFRGGSWALHTHLTPLRVENSRFHGNVGGVKFRGDGIELYGNGFYGNGTAIRYWESSPEIISNTIEENGTGIFSRDGSSGTLVRGNNFLRNVDYHIKLGELQEQDVDARFNYWGGTSEKEIEKMLFDKKDASYLGRVRYTPFEPKPFPLGKAAPPPSRHGGERSPGEGK